MATVLVADDSETVRAALGGVVRELGHEVVAVGTGREALAALRSRREIRMGIVDIYMPELDGLSLIKEVVLNPGGIYPSDVVWIIVSTEEGGALRDLAEVAGVVAWCVKPVQADQLAALIAAHAP